MSFFKMATAVGRLASMKMNMQAHSKAIDYDLDFKWYVVDPNKLKELQDQEVYLFTKSQLQELIGLQVNKIMLSE